MPSIEVSYTASTANFRQGGNSRPNRYILLANAHDSKFYSPMTEYLDSLQSTPEGMPDIRRWPVEHILAAISIKCPAATDHTISSNRPTKTRSQAMTSMVWKNALRGGDPGNRLGADRLNRNYSRLHLSDGHRRFPVAATGGMVCSRCR